MTHVGLWRKNGNTIKVRGATTIRTRFSEYFKLNKFQAELDFVDVFIDNDTPLFVDPYVFKVRNDVWSVECNNLIVDFFGTVIQSIRSQNHKYAKNLLERLSEPNETHLGMGKENVFGKGVSGKQAGDLFDKLKNSKAAKTGYLKDLMDCELMIPGIGFDKISDITTNIIRSKLIEYTQAQCELYNIPMGNTPSGRIWNPTEKRWMNGEYTQLPIVNGRKIILVPKYAVVIKPLLSSQELYNHEILEYIQAEHINAMSSLVEVLKNGKKRVTKKSIKERPEYKMSKEFIYDFCNKNPNVINEYKNRKGKDAIKVADICDADEAYVAGQLIANLREIQPGGAQASDFHNLSFGIMEFLFFPHLMYPKKEREIHDGRKRIDITFYNMATEGFWHTLRTSPTLAASTIMIECKNYAADIKNPELDQISGRFSNLRGWLGIILSRQFSNKNLFLERCKDTAKDGRGVILCLDDDDIINMLTLIQNGQRSIIEKKLTSMYQSIVS